jgi:DNA-binding FadR family transcriptional regulator
MNGQYPLDLPATRQGVADASHVRANFFLCRKAERIPQKGAFPASPAGSDELIEARIIVEPELATRAAERATADDFRILQRVFGSYEREQAGSCTPG